VRNRPRGFPLFLMNFAAAGHVDASQLARLSFLFGLYHTDGSVAPPGDFKK
jgi:hypothetical protein